MSDQLSLEQKIRVMGLSVYAAGSGYADHYEKMISLIREEQPASTDEPGDPVAKTNYS